MQHVTDKHSRLANEIIKAAVKNSDDDGETVKKDNDLTALISCGSKASTVRPHHHVGCPL